MHLPLTWSVGRRLAAIAGIGAVTCLVIGGTAVRGATSVKDDAHSASEINEARGLFRALDTRASELKVDGYKALTSKDPASIRKDVRDDTATTDELLTQLGKLDLAQENRDKVQAVGKAFATYTDDISRFVDGAASDQKLMSLRVDSIQAYNDKTDEILGATIDDFTMDSKAANTELVAATKHMTTMIVVAALVGLAALAALSLLITRSITSIAAIYSFPDVRLVMET